MKNQIIIFARQRGIEIPTATVDETKTTTVLLSEAKALGISGVNTKTRKGDLVAAIRDHLQSNLTESLDAIVHKLTKRQQRNLRRNGYVPA